MIYGKIKLIPTAKGIYNVNSAVREAISIAIKTGLVVKFKFNGIALKVDSESDALCVILAYQNKYRAKFMTFEKVYIEE
jgi:hypothetical protein